jgi:flagellar biosynthesis protein FlhA
MAVMGLVPGMPHFSFLSMAALAGGAYLFWKKQNVPRSRRCKRSASAGTVAVAGPRQETKELGWDDVTPIDMIGLEVGYRLIPLVDRNQGGQLLARIKGVRKKLSGPGLPDATVHIRDNLDRRRVPIA